MESLLLDVPFECRSWYKASLDPSCWQCLIFPRFNYYRFDHVRGFYIDTRFWFLTLFYRKFVYRYLTGKLRFSMNGFVKLVVSRSCGNATSVSLPECSDQILKYVANACPGLKALSLPSNSVLLKSNIIMELTEKLKHLESLSLGNSRNIAEILSQISLHCKNFRRLELRDCLIGDEEASSIIKLVLHIQYLVLRCSRIRRGNFITLLQVCKELVYLDASDCRDFEEDYDDILKLASHIAYFSCEGSQLYDSEDNHGRLISDGESSDDD
ncbi:hypothetical protein PRUPE_1G157700 [Prunus persica]|uniref:F-box domain-containing protein n=2 Tax=Prunus persica TaxID=3760 RepID=M5XJE8_PRUPE|nr:hypothetical protein PRUPE_1G157700 [Prunus persica]